MYCLCTGEQWISGVNESMIVSLQCFILRVFVFAADKLLRNYTEKSLNPYQITISKQLHRTEPKHQKMCNCQTVLWDCTLCHLERKNASQLKGDIIS